LVGFAVWTTQAFTHFATILLSRNPINGKPVPILTRGGIAISPGFSFFPVRVKKVKKVENQGSAI